MRFKKLLCIFMMCGLLAGCSTGSTEYGKSYVNELANYTSGITLNLNENGTFQLVFPYTRTMPYGKYTIEDDVLTCKTLDGTMIFYFQVEDEDTLVFVAENSTESMEDGAIFELKE